jgi:aspartyl protease family protein
MNRFPVLLLLIACCLASAPAGATDVTVAGLFTNKAVVQINSGPIQTLSVGQKTPEGVVLVSVDRESATFEIEGKRVTLGIGHARMSAAPAVTESAVITADTQGHFTADAAVNGKPIRFIVDTGATLVSLPAPLARRLSLDYEKGQKTMMRTANGNAPGYLLKLDTVSVGSVTLHGVDAIVVDGIGLEVPLLGMSFLNRMNMRREGDIMTLTRRY